MDDQTAEVQVQGKTIQLKQPRSVALRMDIWTAAPTTPIRAWVAALAMCWQSPGKPKTQYAKCSFNVPFFGGQVIEELSERGWTATDFQTAGLKAYLLCISGLTDGAQVEEAENFSKGTEGISPD